MKSVETMVAARHAKKKRKHLSIAYDIASVLPISAPEVDGDCIAAPAVVMTYFCPWSGNEQVRYPHPAQQSE